MKHCIRLLAVLSHPSSSRTSERVEKLTGENSFYIKLICFSYSADFTVVVTQAKKQRFACKPTQRCPHKPFVENPT